MLPKENRLKSSRDFDRVFKKSKPLFTKNFAVRYLLRSKKEDPSRFGFIISNKISKLATKRNQLKRQLRHIVHDLIFELKPGYDVIVLVKSDFNYPYEQAEIKKQMIEIFTKCNIIGPKKQ